jgi:phosphoribosylformylglycinamidine synthase subunit PurSL
VTNPDGKFKAAQLVRSCRALKDICLAYEVPLLSGKDSMYVDGHLAGAYGETHKVSAPETLQFSATSIVPDVNRCVTLDAKVPGDLVYVLGRTRDELGGSEFYDHFGYIGLNVPRVNPAEHLPLYRSLAEAISRGLVRSAHGIFRGGLAVHLAMVAMAGELGLAVDLAAVPAEAGLRDHTLLFSESAGRFIITAAPEHQKELEALLDKADYACVGTTLEKTQLVVERGAHELVNLPVSDLKTAWKKTFGDLI